jgi:hypothetical protein
MPFAPVADKVLLSGSSMRATIRCFSTTYSRMGFQPDGAAICGGSTWARIGNQFAYGSEWNKSAACKLSI